MTAVACAVPCRATARFCDSASASSCWDNGCWMVCAASCMHPNSRLVIHLGLVNEWDGETKRKGRLTSTHTDWAQG